MKQVRKTESHSKEEDNLSKKIKGIKTNQIESLEIKKYNKKELTVRPEIIKLLEKTIGSRQLDIGLSDFFFFGSDCKRRETKAKINK